MDLVGHIDRAAAELAADPDLSYEAGVDVASSAHWFADDPVVGEAAASIRDVFGSWVEVIHTHGHLDGPTEAEALQAHEQIESALEQWRSGGRQNPLTFGRRCRSTLARVHAPWLEDITPNVALD